MSAVYPAGVTRVQGETLSLSTSRASLGLFPSTHQLVLYNPSTDFRLHLNPHLLDAVFYDESADSGAEYLKTGTIDLPSAFRDRNATNGSGTLLDSSTTSDFLYLCFYDIIGGVHIVIGSANATSATVAATYRKNDDSWANLSPTDGTDSGGATLAQTGDITWTAPSDWKPASLGGPQGIFSATDAPATYGYWMRLAWGAGLDSDTEIDEVWSVNKDANRGYFRKGTEYSFSIDRRKVGAFEVILASGTDTLQVTHIRTSQ